MKKQMHLAAQYLAAAGISFLENRYDDSHVNLVFNVDAGCLETKVFSDNGDQLQLCYQSFSLIWKSKNNINALILDGVSHRYVLDWIQDMAQLHIGKTYRYYFHYELPYKISDNFVFEATNTKELANLMHMRILAQLSLEQISTDYGLKTDIKIWPYHFDTGIYAALPNCDVSIGLGLAIPDGICDTHYLYTTGYTSRGQVNTMGFKKLTQGYWDSIGFNGAILPITKLTEQEGIVFFKETIDEYKNASQCTRQYFMEQIGVQTARGQKLI